MVTKKVEETADVWDDTVFEKDAPAVPSDRDFLTVTMKAGTGFDVPWLVFHTNSVGEALEALKHSDLDELMDLAARKGKEFATAFSGSQGFAKPAAAASTGGWSQPAPQAVSVEQGTVVNGMCVHGPATQKSGGGPGTGKRAWRGNMCPSTDRNSQCKPEFLN